MRCSERLRHLAAANSFGHQALRLYRDHKSLDVDDATAIAALLEAAALAMEGAARLLRARHLETSSTRRAAWARHARGWSRWAASLQSSLWVACEDVLQGELEALPAPTERVVTPPRSGHLRLV